MRKLILGLLLLTSATAAAAQNSPIRFQISVIDNNGELHAEPSELSCDISRCHGTVVFEIDGRPRKYTALGFYGQKEVLVAFEPIYDEDGTAVFLYENRFHPVTIPINSKGQASATFNLTYVERPEPVTHSPQEDLVIRTRPPVVRIKVDARGPPIATYSKAR